jgi:hypothetical protein
MLAPGRFNNHRSAKVFDCKYSMKAGIVIYRRDGTSLSGQWVHQDTGGILAKELVQDVSSGPMIGDWPVQVFLPDGTQYFTGNLQSVSLGDSLILTWNGAMVNTPQQPVEFIGIGYQIDSDLMVATFEQSDANARQ